VNVARVSLQHLFLQLASSSAGLLPPPDYTASISNGEAHPAKSGQNGGSSSRGVESELKAASSHLMTEASNIGNGMDLRLREQHEDNEDDFNDHEDNGE
jgi:hypothetical protein